MVVVDEKNQVEQDILASLELLGWTDRAALMAALCDTSPSNEKLFYSLLKKRKQEMLEQQALENDELYSVAGGPKRRGTYSLSKSSPDQIADITSKKQPDNLAAIVRKGTNAASRSPSPLVHNTISGAGSPKTPKSHRKPFSGEKLIIGGKLSDLNSIQTAPVRDVASSMAELGIGTPKFHRRSKLAVTQNPQQRCP